MKPYPTRIAERLLPTLEILREEALVLEATHRTQVDQAHPAYRDSARNLLHYLACALYHGEACVMTGHVGPLPEVVQPLLLCVGDTLLLTPADQPGHPAEHDEQGALLRPATIPCTLDAVFDAARPGQPIWFDDGKIGGRIVENSGRQICVEITHAAPQGSKLRAEKGINLPQTDLAIPAFTDADREALRLLAPHVDVVGMSFVRCADDVHDCGVLERMSDHQAKHRPMMRRLAVSKIPREPRRAPATSPG
ncbi:MAG TPA: pyruvate kinase [Rhodocyclaceae bacterium]|nr:pyruvate kinase [Rhodocyclaceae bacterium]